MPCYHPMLGYYDNYALTRNGKRKVRIDSKRDADYIELFKSANPHLDVFPVACGQCIGCRLEYSRQWAIRCMLEAKHHEHNYFLTMTYDNEHLPLTSYFKSEFDVDTGEVFDVSEQIVSTLVPDHFTKFMKDVRAYYDYHYSLSDIRFYGCGEYGDKSERAHYHNLMFNFPIPDLVFHGRSHSGANLYTSEILSKIWSKGFVVIGDVSFQSCSYVARYMLKKQKGLNASIYSDKGIVPPFVRMSRRPGIAMEDYIQFKDKYYTFDEIFITDSEGKPLKVKPPKYFDRLFEVDSPEDFARIKEARRSSAENFIPDTDVSPQAYLSIKERSKVKQISSLIREI